MVLHAATPGVRVHYRLDDPRVPIGTAGRTLLSWNATEGEARPTALHALPPLLLVLALPEEAEARLYQKWVWHGRAHFLVADTPRDLAHAFPETPA